MGEAQNVSSRLPCASCGKPIQEGERVWTDSGGRAWHWACMERIFTPRPEDKGMTLEKAAQSLRPNMGTEPE